MKNWKFDDFEVKTAMVKSCNSNYNVSVNIYYKNSLIKGYHVNNKTKEFDILKEALTGIEEYVNRDIDDVFFEAAGMFS